MRPLIHRSSGCGLGALLPQGPSATTVRRGNACAPRRGIALIDVIVGALMLGVGLAVVVSIGSRSLASQSDGERRMVAAWLADELLTMVLVEGPEEYPLLYDMDGWFYEPFEEYFYSVEIEDQGPGVAYSVTARVGWEVGRGTEQIEIRAAIAQRQGDPEQPREPRERIDRETRHYERLFGEEDEGEDEPPRQPTNTPNSGSGSGLGGAGGRSGGGGGRGGR